MTNLVQRYFFILSAYLLKYLSFFNKLFTFNKELLYYLLKEVFMDNIDTAILYCLKENGRVTASEISKKVKLSIPAVAERPGKNF